MVVIASFPCRATETKENKTRPISDCLTFLNFFTDLPAFIEVYSVTSNLYTFLPRFMRFWFFWKQFFHLKAFEKIRYSVWKSQCIVVFR